MDAVEFLKARSRMCSAHDNCNECRIDAECSTYFVDNNFSTDTAKEIVSTVEQLAKEHPVKTRQSEFLRMYPNAEMCTDVVAIPPCSIDIQLRKNCDSDCDRCRCDYWLQEVE